MDSNGAEGSQPPASSDTLTSASASGASVDGSAKQVDVSAQLDFEHALAPKTRLTAMQICAAAPHVRSEGVNILRKTGSRGWKCFGVTKTIGLRLRRDTTSGFSWNSCSAIRQLRRSTCVPDPNAHTSGTAA